MSATIDADETDSRFMAEAIALSRTHLGLTGSNPSVGTLIVRDDGDGPRVVGRGVTAIGGRPHAETQALAEAGDLARGATAYVTLEPCAHHGRTPPCAEALVAAGVARVVGAASDPDSRVSGKGYAILRAAGISVTEGVMSAEARYVIAGYLTRSLKKRPQVILKLAVSSDGMIGRRGAGQVAITGREAREEVQHMRAEADVIAVGVGTVIADDPQLTCRLPGLEHRSPIRLIVDSRLRTPLSSVVVRTARTTPTWIATCEADPSRHAPYVGAGCRIVATDIWSGRVALPELLEDLAAQGLSVVLLEGGAELASAFLSEGLVDRIALFTGPDTIGEGGVAAPLTHLHSGQLQTVGGAASSGVKVSVIGNWSADTPTPSASPTPLPRFPEERNGA
ncbi:MAG TPA: bifunctional diaminohydroxyphosphoribosylaminopyrimidine deaminase/5-amino-6-(5-phosphoribosylamino)uracil reductase RibD, partial [Rhizobiaceae bacterium]|nr:bifunctional diaminohydroxyphosphoribosylaminopyrimidine deaminase/5-amino-6-(5-phosphoribosylamino)uracil reductase RibD [Rhizobiaceae bacterium]